MVEKGPGSVPDVQIYLALLSRIGLQPARCVPQEPPPHVFELPAPAVDFAQPPVLAAFLNPERATVCLPLTRRLKCRNHCNRGRAMSEHLHLGTFALRRACVVQRLQDRNFLIRNSFRKTGQTIRAALIQEL